MRHAGKMGERWLCDPETVSSRTIGREAKLESLGVDRE